jgi:hypothetical protein
MQQDVRMAEIRDALFDGAELWEDYGRMLAAFSFDFRESERNRLWLRLSSNPQLTAYILRKNRHAVDSILSIFFDDMAAGDEENPRRHKNVFDRVREGQEWVLPLLEGMVREERFIRNYRGWVIELLKAASSGFGLDAGAYKIRTVVLDLPDSEKKALGLIALACLLTDGEAHVRRFAHKLLTSIKADAGMLGVIRRIASPDELALYMLYLSTPHKRLEAMLGIPDGHNPTADTGRPN